MIGQWSTNSLLIPPSPFFVLPLQIFLQQILIGNLLFNLDPLLTSFLTIHNKLPPRNFCENVVNISQSSIILASFRPCVHGSSWGIFQPYRSCRVEKFSIQPITSVEPNSTKPSWVGLDHEGCAYLFYAMSKLSFHELFKHLYSIMYYEAYNFHKLYSKYIYIYIYISL